MSNEEAFDFGQFNAVTTRNPHSGGRASSSYDIRYSTKREKFMIGTSFWEENDLSNNGMTVFQAPGQPVLIGISDEEKASFLTRKKGAQSKTKEFTHRVLRNLLDDRGITTVDISLEKVGESDGYTMFKVEGVEESGDIYEDSEDEDSDAIISDDVTADDIDPSQETDEEEEFTL